MEDNADIPWTLEVLLQSIQDPSLLVSAAQVWAGADIDDLLMDSDTPATEALLRDLGRASRLYPEMEWLLESSRPEALELDTRLAAEFLQDAAPLLERAGFGVFLPSWWGSKRTRLNARLKTSSRSSSSASGLFGLDALVDYRWEVALGDDTITQQELRRLVALKQPLVQVRGEWVLLNKNDLDAALAIIKGGKSRRAQMTAADALRIGLGLQDSGVGLPIDDIEADGWLGDLLSADDHCVEEISTPENFEAELRPYQSRASRGSASTTDLDSVPASPTTWDSARRLNCLHSWNTSENSGNAGDPTERPVDRHSSFVRCLRLETGNARPNASLRTCACTFTMVSTA